MEILTVTINPAVDKSATVDQIVPDDKLNCRNVKYEAGGGGVNVARVIKRLGGSSTALYQCSGPAGEILHQRLSDEGIDSLKFETINWTRENFIVVNEHTQKQYRFGMPGPQYSKDEVEELYQTIIDLKEQPDYLVLSGSMAPGVDASLVKRLCQWGKSAGIKVIVDTSGEALIAAMEVGVYLVKPNLRELCQITGKTIVAGEEQEQLALSLIENGKAEFVVVSLGPRGAMMASKEGIFYQVPPTIKTKSTVGAGDSMVAGMVWALKNGMDSKTVLNYGIACGTAATMNTGTGLCRNADIDLVLNLLQ